MSDHAWISGGCPFKGRRIDAKGNVKYKGHMIVSSHELQFVLSKPKGKGGQILEKEMYPLKDIKSYGCHENVLSVRLGGDSAGIGENNMVYFKLKEAVVVKEIMDQVIEMKRKPTPRMPSFDHAGGFYDMSPTAINSKGFPGAPVERKQSLPSMQDNQSYYDPSRAQDQEVFNNGYSRPNKLERSTSTGSSCSSGGPPSASLIPGHDNPLFQFSPIEQPVQYAQVEMPAQRDPASPDDPFPSPSPPSTSAKKKFPLFRSKSAPKFGYTKVDIEVMEALKELDSKK